jgi:predicted nucleotidyltransferase
MQPMSRYFDDFRKTIEPDKKRKEHAQDADDPVREHLQTHESFADRHVTTFLYGSYRRHTAVGDIKDVDLVVVTNYTISNDPVEVLDALKDSLAELYDDPELADQRRSIRVDRPLPDVPDSKLTLDVIPAIYQDEDDPDGPVWVPDRDKKCWIPSNPKGHIAYSNDLSDESKLENGFVRLSKMMKWWWKYQFERQKPSVASHKRKPKGFWIEVMTGEYADVSKESYPELIVALLENAFNQFKSFRYTGIIPKLPDPGLRYYYDPAYRTVKTSMTEDEFTFFLDTLEEALGWARAALNATSDRTASEYWQLFFGDMFPLAPEDHTTSSLLSPAVAPSGLSFPDKPVVLRKPGGFA